MGWTVISTTSIDADSFITETLMIELRDNLEYLFDSAPRCGEFLTPVRLVVARGNESFLATFDSGSVARMTEATIEFDVDSTDGDPNFLDNDIRIYLSVVESEITSVLDWYTNYIHATPYVEFGSITQNTFVLGCIGLRGDFGGTETDGFEGIVQWLATGFPASGE